MTTPPTIKEIEELLGKMEQGHNWCPCECNPKCLTNCPCGACKDHVQYAEFIALAPTVARMMLAYRKQAGYLKQALRYSIKDGCNISLQEAQDEVDLEARKIMEGK